MTATETKVRKTTADIDEGSCSLFVLENSVYGRTEEEESVNQLVLQHEVLYRFSF